MSINSERAEVVDDLASKLKAALSIEEIGYLLRLLSPTQTPGEMTAQEFDDMIRRAHHRDGRPHNQTSIDAARLVLVMGASQTEAASEIGISRQQLNNTLSRLRKFSQSVPAEWKSISIHLPESIAFALQVEQKEWLKNHSSDTDYTGLILEIKRVSK